MNRASADARVHLFRIQTCNPWEGYLLTVSQFRMPEPEARTIAFAVDQLRLELTHDKELNQEVFIQVEQFDDDAARALFRRHSKEWMPELGLGVWPDRPPPTPWTQEEFLSTSPGERVRPLMFQVLQISTTAAAKRLATELLFPFGSLMEIYSREPVEVLYEKMMQVLLPPIQDPSFTCFPFYVPLFEAKTIAGATNLQLEEWFHGFSVYIRQSFEDNGVLIAAREPIWPIFERMGVERVSTKDNEWLIPVHP